MGETRTYTGGCHCGAVKYRATFAPDKAHVCNCSICSKTGWAMTFIPGAQFELLQGRDALTDYQFGRKHIHHVFCRICGIRSFAHGKGPDGSEMMAVNLRCLDGFDVEALPVAKHDGKSIQV